MMIFFFFILFDQVGVYKLFTCPINRFVAIVTQNEVRALIDWASVCFCCFTFNF